MSNPEALAQVQALSAQHLVDNFDTTRGFALRAPGSHADLWPGDPWVEAYLAIGRTDLANLSFKAIQRSIRPDGSAPHLMQGSRPLFRLETKGIDRMVFRATGVGSTRSASGERVTKLHAQPGWALSTAALYDYKLGKWGEMHAAGFARSVAPMLVDATRALYKARGTEDGYVASKHIDEMTNRSGELAKLHKPLFDPSVNALLVKNNAAVVRLADIARFALPQELRNAMAKTNDYLTGQITDTVSADRPYLPEYVLAAARLGSSEIIIDPAALQSVYAAPSPEDPHPEKKHLSTAECVEIARLTLSQPDSRAYLDSYITAIAGGQPIKRFENSKPSKNAVDERLHRSQQTWLPTDAQLVQVPAF